MAGKSASYNWTRVFSERHLTLCYVAALSIVALLTIVSHLTLNRVLSEHEGSAAIVNVSGRQRMLSQRIASLAAQYRLGSATARADLLTSVDQFESAHKKLLAASTVEGSGGHNTGVFRDLYFGGERPLDAQVDAYIVLARQVAAQSFGPALDPMLDKLFAEARAPLLTRLHEVVVRHQQDSEAQLSKLETLQGITLAVVLTTLAVEALLIFRPMVRRLARCARELMRLATTDGLTGTLNRASFLERGAAEKARSRRTRRPFAVLVLDVDHFKRINDTYGHAGGDAALRSLAQALDDAVRPGDVVGRMGGEEFAVLLPETSETVAYHVAKRLRESVEMLSVDHARGQIRMTVSVGVAAGTAELAVLLQEADEALYRAKRAGRNRVAGVRLEEMALLPAE